MSINMTHAATRKHDRWGKNYFEIDFEANNDLTEMSYSRQFDKDAIRPVIGTLQIGNHHIPVTKKELERLRETILDAENSIDRSYRLGLLK